MEIIYAIVKRNNENFYIETRPTDKVIKLKNELINNFYAMEDKDMRLYLEKYNNGVKDKDNTYWIVSIAIVFINLIVVAVR